MKPMYQETFFLSAGEANAEQEMSLPILVAKLIDIATAHANSLGIGNPSMHELHAGWVLSRLTVDMESYPAANDEYEISTWIESFNRHFSERAFRIASPDGRIYGYARSVWMVMDTLNHTNVGLSHFNMAQELILGEKAPITRQARHMHICEPEEEAAKGSLPSTCAPFDYRFKYCDLDSYRHVNTIRYVTLLLNRFSLEEFDRSFPRRLELSFLHEAKYGMQTKLLRNDTVSEGETLSCFLLKDAADGSPLLFARMFLKERKR